MKNLSLFILLGFLIITSKSLLGQNDLKTKTSKLNSHSELIDLVALQMEQNNISGLSATIIKNGKEIWNTNLGMANRETNLEVSDSVLFLMYSTTKLFTGIGIMQLWEQGLFDLDDPINNYLPFSVTHPDYPEIDITFKMLMSHVSGINDNGTLLNNLMVFNNDTPISLADFCYDYFSVDGNYYGENTTFTNLEPGTTWKYSNTGITLLGYLIEVLSGQDYTEYIEEHILLPLEMNESTFYLADLNTDLLANEYVHNGVNYIPKGFRSCPVLPAGFLHSPREEIKNFQTMLLNDGTYNGEEIIEASTLELMQSIHYPNASSFQGLVFAYISSYDLWGHSGGYNQTMKTNVYHNNEENWGVSMLCNGAGDPWGIVGMLYQYAREHRSITNEHIEIVDDGNLILESNEIFSLNIYLRNNLLEDLYNIHTELHCSNENISIINNIDTIPELLSGELAPQPAHYHLQIGEISGGFNQEFSIWFYENGTVFDSLTFDLFIGESDVLVIKDETHYYCDRTNATSYYESSIENAGFVPRIYDINKFNFPSTEFLENFDAVIWYTGLDNTEYNEIFNNEKQLLLSNYLNGGGHLFISSQNIGDAIGESEFFHNYLHANHLESDYEGYLRAVGIYGSEIGNGLDFNLTGGDGSNNLESASVIEPINGAQSVFTYYNSEDVAGIMYNNEYQLVFLPFGFSAISHQSDRDELMNRILDFLMQTVQIEEINESTYIPIIFPNPSNGEDLKINTLFQDTELTIYNTLGEIVYYKKPKTKVNKIPHLSNGIYLVTVITKQGKQTQKLIIEN